jgi:hypothetical protein
MIHPQTEHGTPYRQRVLYLERLCARHQETIQRQAALLTLVRAGLRAVDAEDQRPKTRIRLLMGQPWCESRVLAQSRKYSPVAARCLTHPPGRQLLIKTGRENVWLDADPLTAQLCSRRAFRAGQ